MIWIIPALLFSGLDILALQRKRDQLRLFTRPLPTVIFLFWIFLVLQPAAETEAIHTVDASFLFFAFLLMLIVEARELVSFPRIQNIEVLRALYLIGSALALGGPLFPGRYLIPGLILSALVLLLGIWLFLLLAPRVVGAVRIALGAHFLLVSTLLLSAATTLVSGWGMVPSYTVIIGALLWYFSAFFERWWQYVEPHPEAEIRLHVMFLAGQICLAAGAGMQALGVLNFTI